MKNKKSILKCFFVLSSAIALASCNGATIPDVIKGEDTLIDSISGSPDTHDAKEVIYATIGKLNKTETYTKEATTITKASKGVINYTQETHSKFVRNSDEYYTQSSSHSSFVNSEHEAFYKNNLVAYRQDGSEIKTVEAKDYASVFGVLPTKLLSGQIFNQETIIYAKLVSTEDNKYTYNVILDKDLANAALVYQMKEFGGLSSYPTFNDNTEFNFTIDNTYTPISFTATASYTVSVPVLGELPCKEETSGTFANFNEVVSVPNTAEFNNALNTTPTTITPSEDVDKDENLEAIVNALINSSIDKGVALNGTIDLGDYQLPIKINARANVDDILSLDTEKIKNAIDATLTIPTVKGNLRLTYHAYKMYVEIFDKKYVFNLPESEVNNSVDNTSIIENLPIVVSKDETVEGKYNITLKSDILDSIKEILSSYGIIDEDSNFDLSLSVSITNNKISRIVIIVTLGDTSLKSNFAFSDEVYELPQLSEFESQINLKSNLSISLQNAIGELFNGDIVFKYNCEECDVSKAIFLDAKLNLGSNIASQLKTVAGMVSGLPDYVSVFFNCTFVRLIIDNGRFFIGAGSGSGADEKILLFKEIGTLSSSARATRSTSSSSSIFELLSEIASYFVVTYSDNKISISLNESAIGFINELSKSLFDVMTNSLGYATANSIISMFGLFRVIKNIELVATHNESNNFVISLNIDAYEMSLKSVYNENIDYEVSSLFNMTLTSLDFDDTYALDWDYISLLDKAAQADVIACKIATLSENFSLSDEYNESLTAINETYNAIEDKQVQDLVYNYSKINDLNKNYSNQRNAVNAFVKNYNDGKSLSSLTNAYKNFSDAQLEYLSINYNEVLVGYKQKRIESEQSAVTNIQNSLKDFKKDVETLSNDELYNYLNSLVTIKKNINNCLSDSLASVDLTDFNNALDIAIDKYVDVYTSLAISHINELKEFQDECNLTVDEMNTLYTNLDNFYNKYAKAFTQTSSPIVTILSEKHPEFNDTMLLFNAYLNYNGLGYNAGASKVAEREIEAIVAEKYNLDELNTKIAALDELVKHCGQANVSNYSKIVPIKETLEIPSIKEKLVYYTEQINNLYENGTDDDFKNFFNKFEGLDWGCYDDIEKWYGTITFSQKAALADEYKALGEALEKILEKKPDDSDDDWGW